MTGPVMPTSSLVVSSSSPPGESGRTERHTGHGIDGMAERARLAGGALEAGPHGSGWSVRLALPIRRNLRGPT
ncbi:hypothetical protein [Gordonia bronchialis]|uniref:hypothetical protein n=1 Tax=Gordonia bronchialis TaxID=2054 RepID=UPI00226F85D0|nr:hypothetical protein [Gordonia bronchialis]